MSDNDVRNTGKFDDAEIEQKQAHSDPREQRKVEHPEPDPGDEVPTKPGTPVPTK